MIISHRGDWRHAPENSLQAYENCIREGIDCIEIDIHETSDGHLIIMHDATLNRTTNGKGLVQDKTLAEIKSLYLRSPLGIVRRQRVPTFDEVLKLCKGKILIMVDKWQPSLDKILTVAKEEGCLDQLIFRSTYPTAVVKTRFGEYLNQINYIPVIVTGRPNDEGRLDDYLNQLHPPAIGFSFAKADAPILDTIPALKEEGYRIWFNAMWGSFNDDHDDELATENLDKSYGWLLDKGANMIFTGRPLLLKKYLEQKGRR